MKFVVLGDPVEHSRSPAIHTAALATLGMDGTYTARRVDDRGMVAAVDEIRYGRLTGANVTMPHKQIAFELCDRVSESAMRSGAVNTLVRRNGEVWGFNTDVDGIRTVWVDRGLSPVAPVLLLGTGGAAAGALTALAERTVVISGRRDHAARDLLDRTRVKGTVVPWGTPAEGAVIVNATPIGMNDDALPEAVLTGSAGLFDLTYSAAESPSARLVRGLGLPVADGRDLLIAQAAVSFEIWTGVPAPIDVMREAFPPPGD